MLGVHGFLKVARKDLKVIWGAELKVLLLSARTWGLRFGIEDALCWFDSIVLPLV